MITGGHEPAGELNWIFSGGGPLALLPTELADLWLGADGACVAKGTPAKSDYEFACRSDAWLTRFQHNGTDGLLLSGEPLETAWIAAPNGTGGSLVRWEFGGGDRDALVAALGLRRIEEVAAPLVAEFPSDALLFDAAWPAVDAPAAKRIPLRGPYRVITERVRPNERASFVVHRFIPIGS